jgi:hypothetical protein
MVLGLAESLAVLEGYEPPPPLGSWEKRATRDAVAMQVK